MFSSNVRLKSSAPNAGRAQFSSSRSLDGLAYVSLRFPNLEEAIFCQALHRRLPQTWNDVPLFLANLCSPAIRKIVILTQT